MTAIKRKPDLTQGPLLSKILLFVLPLIATSVLQLLFNTADTIVVGRWGGATPEECETALAAVGSCGSLTSLLTNLFIGLSVGAGVCVAHGIGARHYDEVEKAVHTAIITALVSGAVVTVVGLVFAPVFLEMMQTEKEVLNEAVPYMRAYFCGMPAAMLYNYCAAILRSYGDTTRPLVFLSIAGVVNVGLNLVMVLVFRTGAMGVGIATAASQWVSCALIVWYMLHIDGPCRLDPKKLRADRKMLRKIIFVGLPAGVQSTLFSISNVQIQSSINSLGKVVVAGNAAAANLESYVYVIQNSLYHAALTFVGQNMGAKRLDRVKKSIFYCVAVVTVFGAVSGGLVYLFGKPLLSVYIPDNVSAIRAGITRLSIISISYFLCGIMEVGSGVMRGFGRSIAPMIVSLIGSCVFRVVWVLTVFESFRTLESLYVSYPISWIMTGFVHFVCCFLAYRTIKKRHFSPLQANR